MRRLHVVLLIMRQAAACLWSWLTSEKPGVPTTVPGERKRLEIRRIERPCGTVPHQGAEI
jgi:hypothetical protein